MDQTDDNKPFCSVANVFQIRDRMAASSLPKHLTKVNYFFAYRCSL